MFGAALAVIAVLYFSTNVSRVALFWAAFVLTRPLGATLGDLADKPVAQGGFDIGRITASLILVVVMLALVMAIPQRAGEHPGARASSG